MKAKNVRFRLSLSVLFVLAALAWFGAAQPALAATANFTFTSNSPSGYFAQATFTVSATGDDPTYAPLGYVTFYDGVPGAGGTAIQWCGNRPLNMTSGGMPQAGIPAVCQTTGLAPGEHTITAVFMSVLGEIYANASLTLVHVVTVTPITITPDTLPDGKWGAWYTQPLTVTGTLNPVTWTMTGTPAPDVYVSTHTGGLDGLPTMVGTFNFGVIAVDYAGGYGTKDYSLTIQKATPLMTVTALDAAVGEKMRLEAEVRHSSPGAPFQPTGTVSFSIDGAAVTACSGASAPAVQPSLYAICYVDLPSGIAGGTHVVQADYLPDVASSGAYTSASGTANLKVLYTITGLVFEDLDLDGVRDDGEILSPWKIDLDQDCDGTIDQSQDASQFSFDAEAGGKYCLQADESANWRQTTQIQSFTADANKYFEIGITYHELTFDKTSFEGEMGVAFEAVVTASGGTPPYAFTITPGALPYPEGLTYAVDGSAGTLTFSGTPTKPGSYDVAFTVSDSEGISASLWVNIDILIDGTFTFTSAPNPSAVGQEVTFTLSATGDGVNSLPYGPVAFMDGDTAIPGCSWLYLNFNTRYGSVVALPAVCKTFGLSAGVHTIKAVHTDWGVYYDATLTLQQQVESVDTTPPVITPNATGTVGENGWYTGEVNLTWTVTDAESTITSQTGCDAVTITGDQAATTYTCSATSAGGTNSVDATIKRDATKPVVQVTGVTEGNTYARGSVPAAGCSTQDNLSGVAAEATLALTGGDSQGVGDFTATCSGAADKAGNAGADAVVHYSVFAPTKADLRLSKVDSKDPIKGGATLQYTLKLFNLGPDAAQDVQIVDTLDPNTTFVSFRVPAGVTCSHSAGVITCTGASLDSDRGVNIVITVLVKKGTPAGKILVNQAEASSATYDTDLTNNSISQSTKVAK